MDLDAPGVGDNVGSYSIRYANPLSKQSYTVGKKFWITFMCHPEMFSWEWAKNMVDLTEAFLVSFYVVPRDTSIWEYVLYVIKHWYAWQVVYAALLLFDSKSFKSYNDASKCFVLL